MKKILLWTSIFVALLSIIFIFLLNESKKDLKTKALDTSARITDDADWNNPSNSKGNITVSGGAITINNRAPVQIDDSGKPVTGSEPNPGYNAEGHTGPLYGVPWGPLNAASFWWQIDLGESIPIGRIYLAFIRLDVEFDVNIYASDNATDWDLVDFCTLLSWDADPMAPSTICDKTITPTSKRYWKIAGDPDNPVRDTYFNNFEIYQASSGVYIAAIDGGENFWEWQNFTDDKIVPANTSVTYSYRTRAGETWTPWVSNFNEVISRSEDNQNKYRILQIKATLVNTDNSSSPSISQFDIDYHTNQKPGAPTAQTAVVQ